MMGKKWLMMVAAIAAVFFVDSLSLIRFVPFPLSVVKGDGSSVDFVLDGVVRASQMFRNSIDRLAVFQTHFDFMPLFA